MYWVLQDGPNDALQDGPNTNVAVNVWNNAPIVFYVLPYVRQHDVCARIIYIYYEYVYMQSNLYIVCVCICTYICTLQDGPNNIWDTSPIAFYLLPYIRRHDVRALVTFDGHGVSGVLQCVAVCCSGLPCFTVCCSVRPSDVCALVTFEGHGVAGALHCVAACCSVLLCVVACCSVMRWVAVCCCSVL